MYLLFLEMSQLNTEEDSLDWDRERGEGQPDHHEVHEQEAWCLGTVKADGCGQRLLAGGQPDQRLKIWYLTQGLPSDSSRTRKHTYSHPMACSSS